MGSISRIQIGSYDRKETERQIKYQKRKSDIEERGNRRVCQKEVEHTEIKKSEHISIYQKNPLLAQVQM